MRSKAFITVIENITETMRMLPITSVYLSWVLKKRMSHKKAITIQLQERVAIFLAFSNWKAWLQKICPKNVATVARKSKINTFASYLAVVGSLSPSPSEIYDAANEKCAIGLKRVHPDANQNGLTEQWIFFRIFLFTIFAVAIAKAPMRANMDPLNIS